MQQPKLPTRLFVLRVAWWLALTILVVHVVIWPSLLAEPSTQFGSDDGDRFIARWLVLGVLVWLLVGGRAIAASRSADPYTDGTIEVVRNAGSGAGAILTLIMLVGLVMAGIAALAWATGGLLT